MKHTGAETIIRILEKMGIEIIAGIPGGANLPLYDALYSSSIRHILVRHEQAAGFIAQGMARSTGRTAVCFATSGPGATNLLTAIADAKMDSIPIIAITGQVSLPYIGTDAFQEVDTYGLSIPITKHNFLVRSAKELPGVLSEAFRIASSGRPGPVLIDVPKNVQNEIWDWDGSIPQLNAETEYPFNKKDLEKAAAMIEKSNKPLLYIGGGIIHSNAGPQLKELAEKNSLPAALTLMGLGSFPSDNELCLGMLGMHGAPYTNYLMKETDLLIACGTRFDDRATGKVSEFCPDAEIIHIDIDHSEIDKIKQSHLSLNGDISAILSGLIPLVSQNDRPGWREEILRMKKAYPMPAPDKKDILHPANIIRQAGGIIPRNAIITTDVGQHQMWTAQWYPFKEPRTFLTSGGLGTMGFGLPAAIGAALANPDRKVVCFSGDGSILMNIQELATLCDLNLNITIILMNNGHLGLVRQQQELFYNKHYIAAEFKTNPDFKALGEAFGIKSFDLTGQKDPYGILKEALAGSGPTLVNIPISPEENVLPMVPPGAANFEMIGG